MEIININLPKTSNKVFITFSFNHGYELESNKQFGIGHLAEHYIFRALKNKYKIEEINGEISDNYINFFIELTKKEYKLFLNKNIKEELNDIAQNIDNKILYNEKKRIEIELEEKYSDIYEEIEDSVESKIIKSPKFITRNRNLQLRNIKRFTKKDVSNFINSLACKDIKLFVGFADNKDDFKNKKYKKFYNKYKVSFSKNKKLKFFNNNKILKKANNYAIAFEGLKGREKLSERMALRFLISKVYDQFDKNNQKFGVYQTDFLNRVTDNYGLIWFSANSYSQIPKEITETFFQSVKEVVSHKELEKNIKDFKRETKKNIKEEWKDLYQRLNWVLYDVLDLGRVISVEESIKSVEGINSKKVKNLASKIFKKQKTFILEG